MARNTHPTHVCTVCGSQVQPKSITPGTFLMEVVLWLFFLLPGLIYSIWRLASRYNGCPVCGGKTLVPIESPAGRSIIQQHQPAAANIGTLVSS